MSQKRVQQSIFFISSDQSTSDRINQSDLSKVPEAGLDAALPSAGQLQELEQGSKYEYFIFGLW